MNTSPMTPGALPALRCLVVKDRVGLGGLPASQQSLALALAWAGLPAGAVYKESEVNTWLKAQLDGAVAFLDTDHVELRRWLVDAGWLSRDGYGREYRAVAAEALTASQRALVASMTQALAGLSAAAWVAAQRAQRQAHRDARRREWQAGQGPSP